MNKEQLQEIYLKEEYYWGKEPNKLASKVLDFIPINQRRGMSLVDLGAGEGRDSVFFAKEGFDVLAVDIAPAGLEKAKNLAKEMNTEIRTMEADLNNLVLPEQFDIVYSIGTLQYIEPEKREEKFLHIKDHTSRGGINVMITFVEHPDVEIAPDWGENEYLYNIYELINYYEDWNILYSQEFIFDCNSSNIPHKHAVGIVIARKPSIQ